MSHHKFNVKVGIVRSHEAGTITVEISGLLSSHVDAVADGPLKYNISRAIADGIAASLGTVALCGCDACRAERGDAKPTVEADTRH